MKERREKTLNPLPERNARTACIYPGASFYLVYLNGIEMYIKGDGGYLVMSDGSSIDVARNKKEGLLKKLLP